MATKKKEPAQFVSAAIPVKISATSRCAVKLRDDYYTIEAMEERVIPENSNTDMNKEWDVLFEQLNKIVDTQIEDILKSVQKKKY